MCYTQAYMFHQSLFAECSPIYFNELYAFVQHKSPPISLQAMSYNHAYIVNVHHCILRFGVLMAYDLQVVGMCKWFTITSLRSEFLSPLTHIVQTA
jgi:hypothetical protein